MKHSESKLNKKGFTLAELLIVVAVIGILVAISIPIFTGQLNKAKYGADEANARSIYSILAADYLSNEGKNTATVTSTFSAVDTAYTIKVKEDDNTENVFKFSGIVEVDVDATNGSTTAPKVTIKECKKAGKAEQVFPAGS